MRRWFRATSLLIEETEGVEKRMEKQMSQLEGEMVHSPTFKSVMLWAEFFRLALGLQFKATASSLIQMQKIRARYLFEAIWERSEGMIALGAVSAGELSAAAISRWMPRIVERLRVRRGFGL